MKITAITVKNDDVKSDVVWVNNDDTAPQAGDVMMAVGSIMQAFAAAREGDDVFYPVELAGITIDLTSTRAG